VVQSTNQLLDRSPRRSVSIWKPCWRGLGQHGRYPTLFRLLASHATQPKSGVVRNDLIPPKSILPSLLPCHAVCHRQTFLPALVPSSADHQWHVSHRWITNGCNEATVGCFSVVIVLLRCSMNRSVIRPDPYSCCFHDDRNITYTLHQMQVQGSRVYRNAI